jgi:ParB family transcriptional regulator, chromosome partitioning protein
MSRRRGLGSGLDALIPASGGATEAVRQIAVDAIHENRSQPRTHFDPTALEELAASIREHGLIQPIIVSDDGEGGYELIAGERRWRAARQSGLREIPALVKNATPQQLLELALVENVQRADLNALEEGIAYQTLKDEFGLTDEAIARRVGKSRVAVVNTRRLIKLVPAAQQALLEGTLSAGHGRALLRFERPDEQESAAELIIRRDLSVREAERLGELASHGHLTPAVRGALLGGAISVTQAQTLLRIEAPELQSAALNEILGLGLSARETEQLVELVREGVAPESAVAQLRRQGRDPRQALGGAPDQQTAAGVQPQRAAREQEPEDAEAQRLFEAALGTPVQLLRQGRSIKLTITLFSDEQLQQLYDRLGG